jgi:hypothetical protein
MRNPWTKRIARGVLAGMALLSLACERKGLPTTLFLTRYDGQRAIPAEVLQRLKVPVVPTVTSPPKMPFYSAGTCDVGVSGAKLRAFLWVGTDPETKIAYLLQAEVWLVDNDGQKVKRIEIQSTTPLAVGRHEYNAMPASSVVPSMLYASADGGAGAGATGVELYVRYNDAGSFPARFFGDGKCN